MILYGYLRIFYGSAYQNHNQITNNSLFVTISNHSIYFQLWFQRCVVSRFTVLAHGLFVQSYGMTHTLNANLKYKVEQIQAGPKVPIKHVVINNQNGIGIHIPSRVKSPSNPLYTAKKIKSRAVHLRSIWKVVSDNTRMFM